ncbi:MAG TPA: magnesium protoporphyrin IX methyltransferase, partial [Woeseiaceae bacterium]
VPLAAMHIVGRLIPHREHRAPAIVPISESSLRRELESNLDPARWQCGRTVRVSRGFYKSQAFELRCECQD